MQMEWLNGAWRAKFGVVDALLGMGSTSITALAQAPTSVLVSVDQPMASEPIRNGRTLFIGGWAADTAGSASIQRVEVFLDGPAGSGQRLGMANYGQPRADVANVYGKPDWRNSGFGL